jgi:WD40 repeat protein
MVSQELKTQHWSISLAPMVFSSDGQFLAGGDSERGTVYLWDLKNPSADPTPLEGPSRAVQSLVFSPDERRLAAGGADGTIRMWDLGDLQQLSQVLEGHREPVISLAFSPDGRRLASAGEDRTVRVWRVALQDLKDFANKSVHRPPLDDHEFWDFVAPLLPKPEE